NGSAAAPAIGRRIVDFEFALAAEAADNVDFPAHLGHRHLGAGGGHWGADDPTADALGEGRGSEQGTAGQQHAAEKRGEVPSPHTRSLVCRRSPNETLWNASLGLLRLDPGELHDLAPLFRFIRD